LANWGTSGGIHDGELYGELVLTNEQTVNQPLPTKRTIIMKVLTPVQPRRRTSRIVSDRHSTNITNVENAKREA
jgi:hypothetical protein